MTCPACQGRRTVRWGVDHDDITCSTCGGTGKVVDASKALVERLKARGVAAYQAGDDGLATLLREAATAIQGRK